MGAIWLGSLPQVLLGAGLNVDVYPGWETRSRSTGGYDALLGIQVHHTASNAAPASDMGYMWLNAPTKPIGALYLARDGRWTVGAAGATNTSGLGGPLATSRGTIPLDAANRYVISIEAANRGDGEIWPDVQLDSYVRGVAALSKAYFGGVIKTAGDVHAHHEWAPTRKTDPAGQSWYASGRNKWNMTAFRGDVNTIVNPPPPPVVTPPTTPTQEIEMIAIDHKPGTPEWTALTWTGVELSHVTNGHADSVIRRAGVSRQTVSDVELDGIIASSTTKTACPPTFVGQRAAVWNANRG